MAPQVSVIVPIYHSEPYLERCCRSLWKQTLIDIEFILIIDGSSSNARTIISDTLVSFPQRQEQVKVIEHAENKGISKSRQEGHELATGQYLFHCDSDDWLEPEALDLMLAKAKEDNSDLVFFDYWRHYEQSGKDVLYTSASIEQGQIPFIDAPLHNKLIRRQLVMDHTLVFPEGINWGEDLYMSVLCQILAGKVSYLPKVLYHCAFYSASYTAQINKDKYLQLVACPRHIEVFLQKEGLLTKYSDLLLQMKFVVKEYFLIHPSLRDVALWETIYPESHACVWQLGDAVPFYLKAIAWLASHHLFPIASFMLEVRDTINRFRY